MPLVRISLRKGKPADYRRALADGVYAAMRDAFSVPDEDRFVLVHEHEGADFVYSPTYLDVTRSDDLVIIQITANDTRSVAQKKQLYAAIAARLAASPGVKPADVFVNLVEVAKENWSFGDGIAHYA